MTKKISFLFVLILLVSCDRDSFVGQGNVNGTDTGDPPKENPIGLKIDFLKSTKGSNLTNVQVGDGLIFSYTITDDEINNKYYITSIGNSAEKHQRKGIDFDLIDITDQDIKNFPLTGHFTGKKVDTLFTQKKTGKFMIRVKKPGNFITVCKLGIVGNNKTQSASSQSEIIFNAVKIIPYTYYVLKRHASFWQSSIWDRYTKLYINIGEQPNDNYLNDLSYSVGYANVTKQYNFKQKQNEDLEVQSSKNSPPNIKFLEISSILFKKEINGEVVNIEYKNIPVIDYGRKDDWKETGNENFED